MLKIDKISKSFVGTSVINNLTIDINDSSIFGLVGVNGSGKSTLLRMIAGIYKPDSGEILFDDHNTYNEPLIRKDIFYVSDDPYFPFASNIKSLKDFYSQFYNFDIEAYKKTLSLFSLDENKSISSFSKGMKRQVMLLMALSIKPKLLMLDEAFDGLDPLVRFNFKQALIDFIEDNKATIIISSHNLKELEDICDSYGILENGTIETYGDLIESKDNINKYQLAFKQDIDEKIFDQFNILAKQKQGSIYNLVIKGDKQEILKKLAELNPLILETIKVDFEELFIYEHKGGNKNA